MLVLVVCLCPSSVHVVAPFSRTVLFPLLCSVLPFFFCLIHWFSSLSSFVTPSKCLKNFICAASKRCSSLSFSTQASLPNFNAALAVMLWFLNCASLFICFPKCLRIAPFTFTFFYNKVKWPRYRPDVAQRVGRGIALLLHDRGTRRGWVGSSTPRPHFTPGKDPVPILQEAGWAPGPVWTGGKSRPHWDSIPDRPARSQSLYRLSYRAHLFCYTFASYLLYHFRILICDTPNI